MKHPMKTVVTVNAFVSNSLPLPQNATAETMTYLRRIAQLEAMLRDQIAYKEAIVAAHAEQILCLQHERLLERSAQ